MLEEAQGRPNWERAMVVKYESLMKNQTCGLTSLPLGKKLIGCKGMYNIKYKENGTFDKYKVWLVA